MSITLQNVPRSARQRGVMLDSSAAFAKLDADDQWHEKAVRGFDLLVQEKRPLYVTSLIIAETHGLISSRLDDLAGIEWLDSLRTYNVIFHSSQDHSRVLGLLRKTQGKGFPYADAFSFLVMEDLGVRLAFTFDHHFQDYGWEIFPGPL